jgi:hypothetical protein
VDDEEDSDEEDYVARPTDAYLLAAQASDDHSVLEVYCYDEATGNLFGTAIVVACCLSSVGSTHHLVLFVLQYTTTSRCLPSPYPSHGWTLSPTVQVRFRRACSNLEWKTCWTCCVI